MLLTVMRSRSPGFTLLEMLVAMAIFAALGVMTSQLVTRIIQIDKTSVERGDRLMEIQQAMLILERDIAQLVPRRIRDINGDSQSATQIGGDFLLEFTRQGWRNPLEKPRSNLQRVAYLLQEEILYRYYWLVLDRADDSEPIKQKLLTKVSNAEFIALDENGLEHSFWPAAGDTDSTLRALKLNLEIFPMGEVNRIWAPSSGIIPKLARKNETLSEKQ